MFSQNIKDALDTLGLNEIPTMIQLREAFLKLCLECHPDKGGNDEAFKSLVEAKEILSKYIKNNVPEDKENEEEVLARRSFTECNVVKVNKTSVTIEYPSRYAPFYDKCHQIDMENLWINLTHQTGRSTQFQENCS